MKPTLRLSILIISIGLFFLAQRAAACSLPAQEVESIEMATPTVTPAILPTTPTDQICAAPTVTATSTTSTKDPDSFKVVKQCVSVEEKLPDNVQPGDELLFSEFTHDSYVYPYRQRVYDFKVGYDRMSPYPDEMGDFIPSPDRKWVAYTAENYVKTQQAYQFLGGVYYRDIYRLKSLKLEVQNAEGRKLDLSYWMVDWQYILGWHDNQHLILSVPRYPAGSVVILNPFTREWKVVNLTRPNIGDSEIPWGSYSDHPLFNSILTHILYRPLVGSNDWDRAGWTLYDLSAQSVLWKAEDSDWPDVKPVWSPTARHFVTLGDINRDALTIQLVGLDGHIQTIASGLKRGWWDENFFTWSPDGKKIAAWLRFSGEQTSFAIADIEDKTLTDMCIDIGRDHWYGTPDLVWSPDGRFVAFDVSASDEISHDLVLFDVKLQRAYLLRTGAAPIAWIKKP